MVRSRSPRRSPASRQSFSVRPILAFLLIASFGILFVGCSSATEQVGTPSGSSGEDLVFTDEDLARFRALPEGMSSASGTGGTAMIADAPLRGTGATLAAGPITLDLSLVPTYNAIRVSGRGAAQNAYRVTNEFLNIRAQPNVTAASLGRLKQGDFATVLEFTNAAWAKVDWNGKPAYAATRYLAKMTSEERLAEEKKVFDGQYFVNFAFVNLRREANQQSEKVAEIPGQAILKPTSLDKEWAQVTWNGQTGFVSRTYLAPFLPTFLVRQEEFTLPVIHYRLVDDAVLQAFVQHADRLKADGYRFTTLRDFRSILLSQEQRDVRLQPKSVAIVITDVSAANVRALSDALQARGVRATVFIQTRDIGLSGITEKAILTLQANGADVQSAAHRGEDLRSVTDAELDLELKQSRQMLEQITNVPVFAVAYPEGGANDRVMKATAAAGYLFGLASDLGQGGRIFGRDQLLRLPGQLIGASATIEDMMRFVAGH